MRGRERGRRREEVGEQLARGAPVRRKRAAIAEALDFECAQPPAEFAVLALGLGKRRGHKLHWLEREALAARVVAHDLLNQARRRVRLGLHEGRHPFDARALELGSYYRADFQ